MPAIVEFPTVVQDLMVQYADLFANQPERQHFAEYLTGLFIAERKTVSGITREFAVTTDQSCLNRSLTEVDWDAKALNQRRLDLLQRDSATHYTPHGVRLCRR
jgi:SRSO17 transposase